MKTILLTGATGFVGTQIFNYLCELNFNVIPVVRQGKEYLMGGSKQVKRVISSPDIFKETSEWWELQCEDVDIIIHAAWHVEPGQYLQSTKNLDCLIGSYNLAKGAVNAGVKRFVGLGTCFEYDLKGGVLSVETPLNPQTIYSGAKAALYLGLSQWLPQQSVEFCWCRLFYLYGEGEDSRRLVPYIHKQLLNGEPVELTKGNQIRDFMDVAEVGRIIVKVALGAEKGAINICSGTPITIKQIALQISEKYNRSDLIKFGVRKDNEIDPPCILGIPNYLT
jgi:nucleoside-diphosphate-sugar epimerase